MLCIKYHSFQSNEPCLDGYKRNILFKRVNQCKSHAKMYIFHAVNLAHYSASPGSQEEKNTLEEPMELEEHVRVPDIEELEVDIMDTLRDRVDLAIKRAIRKRRAALQRKNLLAELEAKERLRVELQEYFNIWRDWEEEQWSYMSGVLIKDTGLEVKASWNPGHPRTV